MPPVNPRTNIFMVGNTAKFVSANDDVPVEIHNGAGDDLYYKNEEDVSTSDKKVAANKSVVVKRPVWVISTGSTRVVTIDQVQTDPQITADSVGSPPAPGEGPVDKAKSSGSTPETKTAAGNKSTKKASVKSGSSKTTSKSSGKSKS